MSEEADVTLDTIYAMVYEEKRKETKEGERERKERESEEYEEGWQMFTLVT